MTTSNPLSVEVSDATVRVARPVFRLSLRFSERKLLLGTIDVLLLLITFALTIVMRPELNISLQSFANRASWAISLVITWFVSAFLFECYNLAIAARVPRSLTRISCAAITTSIVYSMIPYITPSLPSSRFAAAMFPILLLVSLVAWRITYARVFVSPGFQQRVLIVGTGRVGRTLAHAIHDMGSSNGVSHENIGYHLLGFINDDPAVQAGAIERLPILGSCHDLVQLAQQLHPDELVVADELVSAITNSVNLPGQPQRRRFDLLYSELFGAILACREMGISITSAAMLYEQLTGRVPVEQIGQALNVALPFDQSATQRFYLMLRRLFDIGTSLVGCTLLALLIPFIWLANYLTSPGPLFYRQERVGQGGQHFWVIKFRSMVVDAEKHVGTVWAAENDPRITPAGRLLRKMRLDEFPQFWNILKGDMSLIGPRPERPYFVDQLVQQYPFYRVRHAVKPGLTGWAQVKYRYGASLEDSLMKLQYDLYYIKRQGISLDFEILLKTISVVLGLKGR
jgi:exopolysaccharide biosynthesis polyprenyl glycosylphosphotransferase